MHRRRNRLNRFDSERRSRLARRPRRDSYRSRIDSYYKDPYEEWGQEWDENHQDLHWWLDRIAPGWFDEVIEVVYNLEDDDLEEFLEKTGIENMEHDKGHTWFREMLAEGVGIGPILQLIENGIDSFGYDKEGWTDFHFLAEWGHKDHKKILEAIADYIGEIELGEELLKKNKKGKTPYDLMDKKMRKAAQPYIDEYLEWKK